MVKMFRYSLTFIDGTTDHGITFGTEERDVAEYLTDGIAPVIMRAHVFECADGSEMNAHGDHIITVGE